MRTAVKTDKVDLMFRAFSDRTRLRLLNMLRTGETCVCDLVDVLEVPQPKVSRHLAYLRKAGLVVARKDGFWMHYQLAAPKTAFHKSLLLCLGCCFESVPELARDVKKLRRSGSGCCGSTNDGCCG
jgi:ArsR family transcriptional regulator